MVSPEPQEVVQRAEPIYEERLRAKLEATHRDWFLAIEPTSGDYFRGRTIYEAVSAARAAYPNREPYTLRIGHAVAVEIGNSPA
jgi:hypothetical protein